MRYRQVVIVRAAAIVLGQYRIIRQGDLARNFASQICCENAGILCVFQIFRSKFVGEKDRQSPQTQLCGAALVKMGRLPAPF